MLQQLSIQNYAIIDELEIRFSGNLNIITGETGAGKSIIIGALNLILGERADSSALLNKDKKCIIEGLFNSEGRKTIKAFLKENDLDTDDELVLRREISGNGKSRAFINDTPVNLSQLQELSARLVDLHRQFDTLELTQNDFQREVLDALAGHSNVVEEHRNLFKQLQQSRKELDQLKEQKQQFDKEADYNRFQFNELEEANFRENELEEIDVELKMLSNAEGIKGALDKVSYELQEGDHPIIQQLRGQINQLQVYGEFHASLPAIIGRLQAVQVELKDLASELEHVSNHVNYDPQKIESLNERLSLGYRMQKKHGVQSTNELLIIQKQLEEKLQAVLHIDDAIQQKEKDTSKLLGDCTVLAAKISEARKKQVKPLEEKVNKLLAQVGMPNAQLKVDIKVATMGATGSDALEFLFDANRSGQFQPIRKVASGGELSRLMLCIKSLVARSVDLPTLIFDEIDTGISGEAARQVGMIMKDLASRRQILCITHQPQIAGKADAHYFVYKEVVKDAVKTNIRQLSTEERITTIAKMLSGEKPTAAAIENAREMVGVDVS
jgi:DNA repair protein RecN (Recombination protein N)